MDPERRLADLRRRGYNFDPDRPRGRGWRRDDLRRALAPGSFEVARRLMLGYEFADPSIVHAYYDPGEPLEGRTMLLEIRFHGLLRFYVGTRVSEVYDHERGGVRVWGWAYRTLEGHLEQGQMNWEVCEDLDSGAVTFRIHSHSRRAPDPNPILRLGFRLFGRREQLAFLHSTLARMERLTAAALHGEPMRDSAEALTARGGSDTAPAHERLARRVGPG